MERPAPRGSADVSLPTQPGDFPDAQRPVPGAGAPVPRESTQPRLRGFVLVPALLLGAVGVVYAFWNLLPLFIDEGDLGTVPVFILYLVAGFIVGGILGVVVGFGALVGIYLADAIRPGLRSELVGIALAAGSATAIVIHAFFQYAWIFDLLWLHIALTVLVPAVLCRYAAR